MRPWALGSVFGGWHLRWETRDGSEGRQWVHTHTLGQAGNIWAGCCPGLSLVSSSQYWPLIGCWLAPVCLSVLLCIPWHWHQLQSPSSFTQPIPGCGPSQQVVGTGFWVASPILSSWQPSVHCLWSQDCRHWLIGCTQEHSVQWSAPPVTWVPLFLLCRNLLLQSLGQSWFRPGACLDDNILSGVAKRLWLAVNPFRVCKGIRSVCKT